MAEGESFGFGKYWSRFLEASDEARTKIAEDSLREAGGRRSRRQELFGPRFGSGLSDLAAQHFSSPSYSFIAVHNRWPAPLNPDGATYQLCLLATGATGVAPRSEAKVAGEHDRAAGRCNRAYDRRAMEDCT